MSLVVLVLDLNDLARLRSLHPAVGGDQVGVVLHGLGPVVHQVLVDVVGIEQRRLAEGGEQILGDGLDQRLGVAVLVEGGEALRRGLAPSAKCFVAFCWKAANSAWPRMAGFTSASGSFRRA